MKYCLTVTAIYLAVVLAYIAHSLICAAWHSWKLRRAEDAVTRAAIERELMRATLICEGQIKEFAPDYREYGED